MLITSNGDKKLSNGKQGIASGTSIVLVSGTLDGATLTLGYVDELANLIAFTDGVVTGIDTQYTVVHVIDIDIVLRVAGAGGSTNLSVIASGKV